MRCPHCTVAIHVTPTSVPLIPKQDGNVIEINLKIDYAPCPSCSNFIVWIVEGKLSVANGFHNLFSQHVLAKQMSEDRSTLIYPRTNTRPPCPVEVPATIAQEYTEACLILHDSPTASAALSRRCLQHFLRDVAKVKPGDLIKEIQQIIDGGVLPSHISEAIDAVRNIGNFAAHPMKSQRTGEILPVEPAEAEWNLEVLEALFDFYCVQPALAKKRKDALNLKLQEAGRKPVS